MTGRTAREGDELFDAVDALVQEYRRAAARLTPEHSHVILQELDVLVLAADRARRSRAASDLEEARNVLEHARRLLAEARLKGTSATVEN
jgi:hypothetical protein